jgi:hypothetical protein
MILCEAYCYDMRFAAEEHGGGCPASADDVVTCFEELSCTPFETTRAHNAIDQECPEPLACLEAGLCFN